MSYDAALSEVRELLTQARATLLNHLADQPSAAEIDDKIIAARELATAIQERQRYQQDDGTAEAPDV